jgi:hypothetical protein
MENVLLAKQRRSAGDISVKHAPGWNRQNFSAGSRRLRKTDTCQS